VVAAMTSAVKEVRMVLYIMGVCFLFSAAGFPDAVHPIRRDALAILTAMRVVAGVDDSVHGVRVQLRNKAGVSAAGYNCIRCLSCSLAAVESFTSEVSPTCSGNSRAVLRR
jgi:hypothetical protein